jgi:hypothetical protein
MGHCLKNRNCGILSCNFGEQGKTYSNEIPVLVLNSNLNLLEDFNPQRTADPFRWIPQGLFYDLNDNRNEAPNPVIYNVSNYSNQQFFNALDGDISNLQNFRTRLSTCLHNMGTNAINILIIVFVWLFSTATTCNKKINCAENNYAFDIRIRAYPDMDSININDTIWFEIEESTLLKDRVTNIEINYNNAENLGSAISLVELTGGNAADPGAIPSVSSFNFNLVWGKETASSLPNQVKEYLFAELMGKYKFKLAIIPQKKGIYAVGISNASNVFRKDDKCKKASLSIKFFSTNTHIYLLEKQRPGYIPSGLDLTNNYYFKVK